MSCVSGLPSALIAAVWECRACRGCTACVALLLRSASASLAVVNLWTMHPGWPLPAWPVSSVDCAGPHHASVRPSEAMALRSPCGAATRGVAQPQRRCLGRPGPCPFGQALPPNVPAAGHSKPCRLPLERQAVTALAIVGWPKDSHGVASSACSRTAWLRCPACPSGLIAAPSIWALMSIAGLLRSSRPVGLGSLNGSSFRCSSAPCSVAASPRIAVHRSCCVLVDHLNASVFRF